MTFEEMQTVIAGILKSQQQLSEREQWFEKEMERFMACQRELQESDLRRQSELARVSEQITGVSEHIKNLMLIAERLVTNAEIGDHIQADHEERIRRLEED